MGSIPTPGIFVRSRSLSCRGCHPSRRAGWCRRERGRFPPPGINCLGIDDRGEPIHVHVARERKAAKFWLQPVRLEYNRGFAATELNKVEALVRQHETGLVP